VIHQAAYSYFRNASKQDNAAATEKETTKIRKYAELNAINLAPINYQFFPLVVESSGSCSEAACKKIVRIAKSQATVIGIAVHIAVERLFQRISVTLQKFNASMILKRSPKVYGEPSTESKVYYVVLFLINALFTLCRLFNA
jgi:hypothetical protein